MKKFRRVLLYTFLLTVIVCGIAFVLSVANRLPHEVGIRGTITRDGKPLEWKSEHRLLLVTFLPENRETTFNIYPAECDTDQGTFTIAKIPTGKYTVAIQQNDPHPKQDLLNFAFDPAHSTIMREITADGQQFLIDLPKDLPKTSPPAMPMGRPNAPAENQSKPESK